MDPQSLLLIRGCKDESFNIGHRSCIIYDVGEGVHFGCEFEVRRKNRYEGNVLGLGVCLYCN
jgi:hypothetical protein